MNIFKKNTNGFNLIESIEDFLKKTQKNNPCVDISEMNLIDASKTALLCSTHFFAKYPDRKIRWSVADEETKKIISNLKLKNMELEIKDIAVENKVFALK